jgi:dTDP-4-amino-4,6-dideoxygalactose transaminase
MNNVPFLDVGYTYRELRGEIDAAIARVLQSGRYIQGEDVEKFESNFASFVEAKHCVGVANGLDAIYLALRAMEIGVGDEVIVPAHTFIATWLAVTNCGATPVPVEPELNGYNIDPTLIEAAITKKTKALIMVHLYGQPCDIDEIHSIAKRHGLRVIEDAAQAHGATYKAKKIGGHSDVVTWSFYPGKNLGAFGDGGAITTNDKGLAEKIQVLGNYGSKQKYEHSELGVNSRLDPIQAAILDVKLKFLQPWNEKRTELAKIYLNELEGTGLQLPIEKNSTTSSWHLFVIRTKARNELQKHLTKGGVESLIHYPTPPNKQKCYSLGEFDQVFSRTESIAQEILSIPIGPHLNSEAANFVCETIKAFNQFRA